MIVLEDEVPHLFQRFIDWLYSGDLLRGCNASSLDAVMSAQWSSMINLYAFAEKRVISKIQNDLIDTMWKFARDADSYPDFEIESAWG